MRGGEVVASGSVAEVMRAPRTFTREDVVEITCHGGLLPAKLVLDTLLENGARLRRDTRLADEVQVDIDGHFLVEVDPGEIDVNDVVTEVLDLL